MTVSGFLAAVALGLSLAAAVEVPQLWRTRVRHYRWRNRRFLKELRSDLGGRSEEADRSTPLSLSVPAGVERCGIPHVGAPPAPCPLAGAADPQRVAPARPPRVAVHG